MEWLYGIDSVAHQTAIEEGGKTIAVLGGGFNHIYPGENKGLYQQIVMDCGLIISEYAPEIKVESKNFLERNRIVSALSDGVLIIESGYRSGTSVTAKFAKKQGRKVFALPHNLLDSHGIGNNRLIKEKIAIAVYTAKDIVDEIPNLKYQEITKKMKEQMEKNQKGNELRIKNKSLESKKKNKKICANKEYNLIYQFINENPITLNEIYMKSNKTISEINNILLMLEMEDYVEKVAGGYKCIINS